MELPRRIGRYLVLKKLATGGSAQIFLAQSLAEPDLGWVALKLIHPHLIYQWPLMVAFVQESSRLVRLRRRNLIEVFEIAREGEDFYLAMEFVPGLDLRELLSLCRVQEKPLNRAFALWLLQRLLKALSGFHRTKSRVTKLGFVHGDLSPKNVLIASSGRPKLTDFGLTRVDVPEGRGQGTLAYMSPEQALGGVVTQRSDLYSFGVIAYELLVGSRLFQATSDAELAEIVSRPPPLEAPALQDLPPPLQDWLKRLLAVDPNARPLSAKFVRKALKRIIRAQKLRSWRRSFQAYLQGGFGARFREQRRMGERFDFWFQDFFKKYRRNFSFKATKVYAYRPSNRLIMKRRIIWTLRLTTWWALASYLAAYMQGQLWWENVFEWMYQRGWGKYF